MLNKVDSYTMRHEPATDKELQKFLRSEHMTQEIHVRTGFYHNPLHFQVMINRNSAYFFAGFETIEETVLWIQQLFPNDHEIIWFGVTTLVSKIDPEEIL